MRENAAIKLAPTPNSTRSDARLLQNCRQGDTHAWEELFLQYEKLVYSIPLNYGLSLDDASDIVQIAFTALVENLDSLAEDSNLGGWLATVARRHTWRVVQRRKIESSQPLDDDFATLLSNRHSAIEQWELLEWLQRGLTALGTRCQQLLNALYFETPEPSYADLAQRLKLAEGSIGPTRARCLQRMKELLEEAA